MRFLFLNLIFIVLSIFSFLAFAAKYSWSNESVLFLTHMTPYTMMIDHQYKIYLKIKNNDKFWPKGGKIRISYHLLDLNKKMIIRDFVRTYLPKSVNKGSIIELKAKVLFPSKRVKPGKYLLQWDLVEEGVKWYSFQKLIKKEVVYIKLVSKTDFILTYLKQNLKFLFAIFIATIMPGSAILILCLVRSYKFLTFIALSFLIGIAYVNFVYYFFNIFNVSLTKIIFCSVTILFCCLVFSTYIFRNSSKIAKSFNKKSLIEFIKDFYLLLPAVFASIILIPIIISHVAFPNIYDLSTHISFIRKIFDTGLSLPSQVFSFEVPWSIPEKGFYPLASHRLIALVANIAGMHPVDVTFLFFFYVVCFASLTLILFLREFFVPKIQLLLIGLAVSLYTIFPYQVIGWGGLPLLFGTILTPILLILIKDFVQYPCLRHAILLSFGMLSIFLVHPTELYTSFILSIFLLFSLRKTAILGKRIVYFLIISLVIFVLLLFPEINHILYVQFLRSTGHLVRPPEHWPLKLLLLCLLGVKFSTVIFVIIGLMYLFKRNLFKFMLFIALFFISIGIIENYINTPLGNLWQHRIPRIYYNTYFYVPVLWGSGIYAIYRLISINDNNLWGHIKSFILFSIFIYFFFHSYPKSIYQQVSYYFDHYSGMNANDYDAINWLKKNLSQKDIIWGQHGDSSLWIYPYTGLKLFGGRTHEILPYPDFYRRRELQQEFRECSFVNLIKDFKKYNITYIYISRTIVKGEFKAPKVDCLSKFNKYFKIVYKNSDVSIYKIIP